MDKTSEKIVEYIADKLERLEKNMELMGRTTSKLIEDNQDLQIKLSILHRRFEKVEKK